MQISKYIFLFSAFLFLLASCKGDTKSTGKVAPGARKATKVTAHMNHVAIANELCTCMQPLINLNKKIQKLVKQGKTTEVQDMIKEVEAVSDEGEACTERLEVKYGEISGQDEVQVEAEMAKVCPDIARMISNAERR